MPKIEGVITIKLDAASTTDPASVSPWLARLSGFYLSLLMRTLATSGGQGVTIKGDQGDRLGHRQCRSQSQQ